MPCHFTFKLDIRDPPAHYGLAPCAPSLLYNQTSRHYTNAFSYYQPL